MTKKAASSVASTWRSRLMTLLSVLIGSGLLFFVFRKADLPALWAALKSTSLLSIGGVLLATCCANTLQGARFYFLLRAELSVWCHAGLVFASHTGNILLPMRAGELVRPFYLLRWRPHLRLRQIVEKTLIDKLLEFAAVLSLALPVVASLYIKNQTFLPLWSTPQRLLLCVLTLYAVMGALLFAIFRQGAVFYAYTAAFAMWLCNYLVFFSLVPDLTLSLQLFVASSFAVAVPALPGGLGAFEAAFVWVGQKAGIPYDVALAKALVAHFLQIFITIAIGLPALIRWGWPSREAQADLSQRQARESEQVSAELRHRAHLSRQEGEP